MGSLPSLPAAALDVVRVCSDPEGDVGELAEALSHDPTLASQVLRVANSAHNYRGAQVTSLERAAMVLGMRALKVVALGFTLANELPQQGVAAGLDLRVFWHRSVLDAVVARSLARSVAPAFAEEAFLCGLLSDIGKLVLSQAVPADYGAVVAESGGWPSDALERQRLGFSASEAGERVLRAWNVPELLVLGSSFADRVDDLPTGAGDEIRRIADVVGLAHRGAAIVFDADPTQATGRFAAEAQRRFGMSAGDVGQLIAGIEDESREAAGILSLELPGDVSYDVLLEQARSLMIEMSVDAMLRLDETSRTIAVLEREVEVLQSRARNDVLTGLPNRAMLDDFLSQQVHQRMREELPGYLGVILIDVDDFPHIEGSLGREGSDAVVQAVARTLKYAMRHSDVLGRNGGAEFCLVVPFATPQTLVEAGERLRAAVAAQAVNLGDEAAWRVTASFGCACITEVVAPGDVVKLLSAAGAEVYRAKQAGGNRVAIAPGLSITR